MSIYDVKVKIGRGKSANYFNTVQAGYDAEEAKIKSFNYFANIFEASKIKIVKCNCIINNK